MNTSEIEIKEILDRLNMYEKILHEILKNTSNTKVRNKKKTKNEEEYKIHLSFSGLNRVSASEKFK